MILKLIRVEHRDDGIFSELMDEKGKIIARTLEHSYDKKPKLYDGQFTCVRGMHQLRSMRQPFETFEITGVQGHSNILFHAGNWNEDSEGCVLLGEGTAYSPKGQMITASRQTFMNFMDMLNGINTFTLIVQG